MRKEQEDANKKRLWVEERREKVNNKKEKILKNNQKLVEGKKDDKNWQEKKRKCKLKK